VPMLLRLRNYLTGASEAEAAALRELRSIEDRLLKRVAALEQRLAAAEEAISITGQRVARIDGRTSVFTKNLAERASNQTASNDAVADGVVKASEGSDPLSK
jgi:hypothetical protein